MMPCLRRTTRADRHVSAVIICVYAIQKHLIINTIETDKKKKCYQQLIERSEIHYVRIVFYLENFYGQNEESN